MGKKKSESSEIELTDVNESPSSSSNSQSDDSSSDSPPKKPHSNSIFDYSNTSANSHKYDHATPQEITRHQQAELTVRGIKSLPRSGDFKDMTFQELVAIEEKRLEEAKKHYTDDEDNERESLVFGVVLTIMEIIIIVVIGAVGEYPEGTAVSDEIALYPFFRDVNIMIFFGFGFLMTFLRRFAYSAIGFTLLISAFVVQYSLVVRGIVLGFDSYRTNDEFPRIEVSVFSLIDGLFCAAACMISFGATLGKVTPTQLLAIALIEPWLFFGNFVVIILEIGAHDVGGGLTIHTLGAVIGVISTWFTTSFITKSQPDNTSNYSGDIFSLSGTLFLWLLWPSFNAAVAADDQGRVLAVINTFLSLTGSTLAAFLFTRISTEKKFDVIHIQNATLAGGVVMGVAADLNLNPGGAIACGFIAGMVSTGGYQYLSPWLSKVGFQDICGVANLHGIPGILGALVAIFATIEGIQRDTFGFPGNQPSRQALALAITLGMAAVGGFLIGVCFWLLEKVRKISPLLYFNDRAFWNIPSDYHVVVRTESVDLESLKIDHDDEQKH